MGNYLDKPETSKDSATHNLNDLAIGSSSMQGWRVEMEDRHIISRLNDHHDILLLGVFDGHAGVAAAQTSSERMMHELESCMRDGNPITTDALRNWLPQAFLNLDAAVRINSKLNLQDESGTTALVAVITTSDILVANAGDSRAVLASAGKTVEMSRDHKPVLDTERSRIEQAGGVVFNGRVFGNLALSRAIGDFAYKDRDDLPPEKQKVTAHPDTTIVARTSQDEFLLLACDGVWDVMSNDDVCIFIRGCLTEGERDPKIICEELLDHCLDLDSKDNMTAVLCLLPGVVVGLGPGIGARREKRKQARCARSPSSSSEDVKAEAFVGFTTSGSAL
eukprot:c5978_g1_i2.p1 GENE.c5978_g1_i2~~c5978_g1_i2.p1  ORF type:complete len:335 (-),score=76.43 c5978_g1_i2:806-1810(-)